MSKNRSSISISRGFNGDPFYLAQCRKVAEYGAVSSCADGTQTAYKLQDIHWPLRCGDPDWKIYLVLKEKIPRGFEMRWKGRERSENVEDRRGLPAAGVVGGGGIVVLIVAVIAMLFGADPKPLMDAIGQPAQQQGQVDQQAPGKDDESREFIEVVLKDTENVWTQLIRENVRGGNDYRSPSLVIFSGTTSTACGRANSAMGPFYCPADQKVYIDPAFFEEMKRRLNAPGDFAQAYVIAHEVAHHVQNSLGMMDPVNRSRQSGDKRAINRASVRLELQADYLAGVWAHHAQRNYNILEEGDIAEAMNAANQIGDDTLQKMSQGFVVPERFTHGTSAQRVRWFKAGLRSGDLNGSQQLFEIDYDRLRP